MARQSGVLRDSQRECLPNPDPKAWPDYTESEVWAIRALMTGDATPDQQKWALDYMIRAAGTYDMSFRPGDQSLTAFAEGKRFVGLALVWMLHNAPTKTERDAVSVGQIDTGGEHG